MLKGIIFLALVVAGLWLLQFQATTKVTCTFDGEFDLGMAALNDRKAAFMERDQIQRQAILDALEVAPEPAPNPDDPNAF